MSSFVIAIANLKGGTGKSTLAVNLACALAVAHDPAVVIDADPQLTATQWMMRRRLPATVREAPVRDYNAAPSWIAQVREAGRQARFVIIDLPAVLSPALASALAIADLVLVPSSTSAVDLAASTRTLRLADKAGSQRGAGAPALRVVPMRVQRGWLDDGGLRTMRLRLRAAMAPSLRSATAFGEAFAAADWVGGIAPRSGAARDVRQVAAMVAREAESRPWAGPSGPVAPDPFAGMRRAPDI